jgi:predicted amidohydrolase
MTSTEDHERNLARAGRLARRAAADGAQLVAFPENFAFLRTTPRGRLAPAAARELPARLAELARELKVFLLAGSVPEPIPGGAKIHNTSLLFAPGGDVLARYRKIHLFDIRIPGKVVFAESRTVAPGQDPVVVDLPPGRAGLSICYDVRFPELYRHLARQGAELLFVPAAFTAYTGKSHWIPLLRARAIENLAWVVAPAQTGFHGGERSSYGHTAIVNPWGEVVAERARGEGIVAAQIDLEDAVRAREGLPCLDHARAPLLGKPRVRVGPP